ncbi:unnamed protein product [Adineta ricciae]|uniref:Uncharacterized protein n=1 Tax=Adineta ricciae TaxID=249248 RepID=A0A815HMW0_ADIRI|nr:unnamed protein product [Adineta ricciae]
MRSHILTMKYQLRNQHFNFVFLYFIKHGFKNRRQPYLDYTCPSGDPLLSTKCPITATKQDVYIVTTTIWQRKYQDNYRCQCHQRPLHTSRTPTLPSKQLTTIKSNWLFVITSATAILRG